MKTLQELGIDKLSVEEQIDLAHQIMDTVAAKYPREHPSPWLRKFLQDRLQDIKDNPDDFITLEEFEQRAVARFGK